MLKKLSQTHVLIHHFARRCSKEDSPSGTKSTIRAHYVDAVRANCF